MTEIRTVTTLRSKRAEIISSIANHEKRLAQARADLSHIYACIALFAVTGEPGAVTPYVDTHRLFARRADDLVRASPRLRRSAFGPGAD